MDQRKRPQRGKIKHEDQQGETVFTQEGLVVGRGDNRRVISPETVTDLAATWADQKEIAQILDIPLGTLRYNFAKELEKGRAETKQALRRAQIKLALGGNVTMLIWLGKNILGQSDQPQAAPEKLTMPQIIVTKEALQQAMDEDPEDPK